MIVHICRRSEWEAARLAGSYQPPSLASQGFIHASRPEQALVTANRFFFAETDLVLLWIDPQRLTASVVYEPADGDLFPHIYGPLNLEAVLQVSEFRPAGDGVFRQLPSI